MTTPEQLPPFTGNSPTCPKCSKVGAFTRYRAAGEYGSNEDPRFAPSPKGERLERACERCDFIWDEALNPPADTTTEK